MGATTPTPSQRNRKNFIRNGKIPAAYADNMLMACISAFMGTHVQKIKATLPIELLGISANPVTGLTPEERE